MVERATSRWRGPFVLGAILGACTVAMVWLLVGSRPALPADDSAEAGFARDMATHHAQASEMSFVVRDLSTDPRLRALAYDIIVTQTAQRGVFMGWLQQWGLSQASTVPRMSWMAGHNHAMTAAGGLMPGMASAAELERLRGATGKDSEKLFLQLMIRHHEGGVLMARALLTRSTRDEVIAIAKHIDEGQTAEIALMKELLAERGGSPLPSLIH